MLHNSTGTERDGQQKIRKPVVDWLEPSPTTTSPQTCVHHVHSGINSCEDVRSSCAETCWCPPKDPILSIFVPTSSTAHQQLRHRILSTYPRSALPFDRPKKRCNNSHEIRLGAYFRSNAQTDHFTLSPQRKFRMKRGSLFLLEVIVFAVISATLFSNIYPTIEMDTAFYLLFILIGFILSTLRLYIYRSISKRMDGKK